MTRSITIQATLKPDINERLAALADVAYGGNKSAAIADLVRNAELPGETRVVYKPLRFRTVESRRLEFTRRLDKTGKLGR